MKINSVSVLEDSSNCKNILPDKKKSQDLFPPSDWYRNNKIAPDEEQEREDDYRDNTSMSDTGPTAGASGNNKKEIAPIDIPAKDPCFVEPGESIFIHIQRQALLWNT